jgi:hypothetical protein
VALGHRLGIVERVGEVAVVQQDVREGVVGGVGGAHRIAERRRAVGRRAVGGGVREVVEDEKGRLSLLGVAELRNGGPRLVGRAHDDTGGEVAEGGVERHPHVVVAGQHVGDRFQVVERAVLGQVLHGIRQLVVARHEALQQIDLRLRGVALPLQLLQPVGGLVQRGLPILVLRLGRLQCRLCLLELFLRVRPAALGLGNAIVERVRLPFELAQLLGYTLLLVFQHLLPIRVLVEPASTLGLLVGGLLGLAAQFLDALPKVGRGGLRLVALLPSPLQRRLRLLQFGPRLLDGALQALNLVG